MGRPRKNFIKVEEVAKPKRTYTKKVKVEAVETPKATGKYNWKKHVKPKTSAKQESKSIETLEQQVDQLTELLTGSIESQLQYHQVATEAEDKFRELAKETERCLNMIVYHCGEVQRNTGSLTSEDVEYSVSLIKRVIENKFKKD
jgi:hypothetical protein